MDIQLPVFFGGLARTFVLDRGVITIKLSEFWQTDALLPKEGIRMNLSMDIKSLGKKQYYQGINFPGCLIVNSNYIFLRFHKGYSIFNKPIEKYSQKLRRYILFAWRIWYRVCFSNWFSIDFSRINLDNGTFSFISPGPNMTLHPGVAIELLIGEAGGFMILMEISVSGFSCRYLLSLVLGIRVLFE